MTAHNNRQRGKANERALAKRLGGKRVGIMGGEDIEHPIFSIETKTLKKCAVRKYMRQAVSNCSPDKTPIVIIHEPNQRRDNDLVIITLQDWEAWYGKIQS